MSVSETASSPFNRPDADVILRSSDGIDFQVHKIILSIASPFFSDLFTLPQPQSLDGQAPLPIVPFDEDSATLVILLHCCYPADDPTVTDAETLNKVLKAADKYQIDRALNYLQSAYIHICTEEISKKPIQAYALACQYKWKNLIKIAVTASLYLSHNDMQTQFESIDCSSIGNQSIKLIRYHFKCCTATRLFLNSQFMYAHNVVNTARGMTETSGPLAIAKALEPSGAIPINLGGSQLTELLAIPGRLRSHVNGAVGKVWSFDTIH
ncbi:hypothetical protein ONZ45_g4573 [Pleurotus djamor]|nr:hypothetical protein ONZ45_g4573 [Pleurotus djamor]